MSSFMPTGHSTDRDLKGSAMNKRQLLDHITYHACMAEMMVRRHEFLGNRITVNGMKRIFGEDTKKAQRLLDQGMVKIVRHPIIGDGMILATDLGLNVLRLQK